MALLLPLLLLLDGAAAAYPPTAPGDVKALCDLYFATGGANWKVNTRFNTCQRDGTAGTDPCDYYRGWTWASGSNRGVFWCDTTGQSSRVTQL